LEELAGKVAVITGGASGIGFATAKALAREGMKLVLADIEQGALDKAVPEIEALGAEAIGVRTDVSKLDQVQTLADRTWERFGGCHVLFNNAGVAVSGRVDEMSHQDWQWIIDVDLWGPIHGVEVFVPRMIEQGEGGHILSTASFAGLVANDGLIVYCVAKYGVVALQECLYRDLSPYGIGSSVLCPMRVQTNIDQSGRNRPVELGGEVDFKPSEPTDLEQRQMAGRHITAEEVAGKVVEAIKKNKLYILPHEESRQFIHNRFRRIDRTFEDATV
jgi:NAD(P)-dependent dehydrogenase (short-subunit alcohol dehydrogenase family)